MTTPKTALSEEQIEELCEAISFCLAKNNNSLHEKLTLSLQEILHEQHSLRHEVNRNDEHIMEMLVGRRVAPSMTREGALPRATAIESLRSFVGNARKITICDPYLFATQRPDEAMDDLANILPRKFDQVELFVLPSKQSKLEHPLASGNPELAQMFTKYCRERGAKIRLYLTPNIHDRIWIKQDGRNSKACLVGTSLNGLGNRISFILGLPKRDLDDFEFELSRIRQTETQLDFVAASNGHQ
jgi:hypothetical protein